ncbi:MAG: hypothetical protein ACRD1L_13885, partial [Terriglobales bacterium]
MTMPAGGNHNHHPPGAANGAGRHASAEQSARSRAAGAAWSVRIVVPGLPLQSCSVLLTDARGRHLVVDTGFPQHDA